MNLGILDVDGRNREQSVGTVFARPQTHYVLQNHDGLDTYHIHFWFKSQLQYFRQKKKRKDRKKKRNNQNKNIVIAVTGHNLFKVTNKQTMMSLLTVNKHTKQCHFAVIVCLLQ